jgi:hypothetical protein
MQGFDPSAQGAFAATGRALQERLSRFFPPSQFVLQLMPAAITKTVWAQLTQRVPFIGIAFLDVEVPPTAGVNPVVVQHWQVHLVVRASTPELRLLGDRNSPGLVNMTGVALLGLHGWAIEDVGTVSAGTAVSLGGEFLSDNFAVVGIPLSIPTMLVPDEAVAALDDLGAIDITWNFDPAWDAPTAPTTPGGTDTTDLTDITAGA